MACNCPDGYVLLDDGVTCERVNNASPIPPTVRIAIDDTIEGGSTPGFYGLLTYENITSNQSGGTRQWPLLLTPQVTPGVATMSVIPTTGPNWTSISPAGNLPDGEHQLVATPVPGVWPPFPNMGFVSQGTCLRESIVSSNVLYYGTGAPVLQTNNVAAAPWQYGTWANDVGVWPSDLLLTNYKWVGLSACLNVEIETTYYILLTANNAFRIKVDGELAVEMNVGDGLVLPLGFVNAFPLTLAPGFHNINVEAFNFSGGGQFSCDILNISEIDLLTINNISLIDTYRVFSTKWRKPRNISVTANGTTTVTSVGQFLTTDTGAFLNVPGFPADTYITEVIDINTVTVNQVIPPTSNTGELYFIWETGDSIDNIWSCPNGFEFTNCGGPECFQIQTTPCVEQTCYLLTPCDPLGTPIKVNNDLSANVGQVVTLCPANLPPATPTPVQTGTPIRSNPNDTRTYVGTLTACCPGYDPIYVTNDSLSTYLDLTLVIPSIDPAVCWTYTKGGVDLEATFIDLTGAVAYNDCAACTLVNPCVVVPSLSACACFTVTAVDDCSSSITLILNEPLISFVDCSTCEPVCYLLTNCLDPLDTILTYTNLEDYVGQVIKLLDTCPDKCWTVTLADNCIDSISVQQSIEVFATCEACLPPVPEVPFNLKTRAVKPGFYTLGCPPKYTLAVNCKFAEVVYSQMAVKRYGITPCCDDEDTNKWLLDKEMLDLKALYDPSLCVSTIERCCPVKCLEVTLEVFRPVPCLVPTNLVSTIILF